MGWTWNGLRCLAISDFLRTRKTVIVRKEDALRAGTASGNIEFSYTVDVINKMSLEKLRRTGSARQATVRQFAAPSRGVEDLAWDGEAFWTSDETVFHFFRGHLDSETAQEATSD